MPTKEKNFKKQKPQPNYDIYEEQSNLTKGKLNNKYKNRLNMKDSANGSVKSYSRKERKSLANDSLKNRLEKMLKNASLRDQDSWADSQIDNSLQKVELDLDVDQDRMKDNWSY